MSQEGFVRLSKENIDLKAKVQSLEQIVDQLRTEVQKTNVNHFHIVTTPQRSHPASGAATPRLAGGSTSSSTGGEGGVAAMPAPDKNNTIFAELVKTLKMKLHESEMREKDLLVALKVTDMACIPTDKKFPDEVALAMSKIQNAWTSARLPEDLAHIGNSVVCSYDPSANQHEGAEAVEEQDPQPTDSSAAALEQVIADKDQEMAGLYATLAELEEAKETLATELEAEKTAREEAEEHWRESHASATAYYEEAEALKLQIAELQEEIELLKIPLPSSNSHILEGEAGQSPSSPRGSVLDDENDANSLPSIIPPKYDVLVAARLEEDTFLMREEFENQIETLKEKLHQSEDKAKKLSVELGKQQLELRKCKASAGATSAGGASTTSMSSQPTGGGANDENVWEAPSPLRKSNSNNSGKNGAQDGPASSASTGDNDLRLKLESALAEKKFALAVKEEALNAVREMTQKNRKLEVEIAKLRNGSNTAGAGAAAPVTNSSWADEIIKKNNEELLAFQERVAYAEAENRLAQQALIAAQDERDKEAQEHHQKQDEFEKKVKTLEKRILEMRQQEVANSGGGSGLLTSPVKAINAASNSQEILMSKMRTSGAGGSALMRRRISAAAEDGVGNGLATMPSSTVSSASEFAAPPATPAPPTSLNNNSNNNNNFKERILMKRLMLQQQRQSEQQQQQQPQYDVTGKSHKHWDVNDNRIKGSVGGSKKGAETMMTEAETTECVTFATDKAAMITQRLQRALASRVASHGTAATGGSATTRLSSASASNSSTNNNNNNATAASFVIASAETSDFLAEMLADALVDYEITIKNLQNEILSYQTIIAVREGDAEEERRKVSQQYHDEYESLRVAKMLQQEEEAERTKAEMERLKHDQRQFQIQQQKELLEQFEKEKNRVQHEKK